MIDFEIVHPVDNHVGCLSDCSIFEEPEEHRSMHMVNYITNYTITMASGKSTVKMTLENAMCVLSLFKLLYLDYKTGNIKCLRKLKSKVPLVSSWSQVFKFQKEMSYICNRGLDRYI